MSIVFLEVQGLYTAARGDANSWKAWLREQGRGSQWLRARTFVPQTSLMLALNGGKRKTLSLRSMGVGPRRLCRVSRKAGCGNGQYSSGRLPVVFPKSSGSLSAIFM